MTRRRGGMPEHFGEGIFNGLNLGTWLFTALLSAAAITQFERDPILSVVTLSVMFVGCVFVTINSPRWVRNINRENMAEWEYEQRRRGELFEEGRRRHGRR